jgi:hypothetical protein
MPSKRFIPVNLLFSPPKVLNHFEQLRKKYGDPIVFSSSRFKSAREARAAAMFAIALSKHRGADYWIGSPSTDPPDALVVEFRLQHGKSSHRINTPIKVMEWEKNSPHNAISDAIEAKLLNKRYSRHTALLVVMHDRDSPFQTAEAAKHFEENPPRVGEIWILCNAVSGLWPSDAVARVFPRHNIIRFDLSQECRRLSTQHEVIEPHRGTKSNQELLRIEHIELP